MKFALYIDKLNKVKFMQWSLKESQSVIFFQTHLLKIALSLQ